MAQKTREEWRKAKKDHGIPDAVCKFSLGERLARYSKACAAAGFNTTTLEDSADDLLADLKTYATALRRLPDSTFKGKTESEKKRNGKAARDFVDEMIDWEERNLEGLRVMSRPLDAMHKAFKKAVEKYRALLVSRDKKAVSSFYTEEMRMIGTPMARVLNLSTPLPAPALQALSDFRDLMDEVDAHVADEEAEEAFEKMYTALRTISPVFGG